MPINIKMKLGFMYLSSDPDSDEYQQVPMPGNGMFKTTFSWQSQTSADGSTVGQQLGRSRAAQDMSWDFMNCTTWWDLCNWIESVGMSFYARFFDFNHGTWKTRRFYVTEISCSPYRPASPNNATNHGKPMYLKNCRFSVYDMGEVENR